MEKYEYFKKIDDVLPNLANSSGYKYNKPTMSDVLHIDLDPTTIAIEQLIIDGYMVKDYKQMNFYRLTSEGRKFIINGGYLAKFAEEERQKKRKERKELIDLKNAERIFTTYWWTFGFAVAGLAISIYLLILKLKE